MIGQSTFSSEYNGVSAPNSGRDPANFGQTGTGTHCSECGHAGHMHDKERVYPDDGPAGSWHWRYVCP